MTVQKEMLAALELSASPTLTGTMRERLQRMGRPAMPKSVLGPSRSSFQPLKGVLRVHRPRDSTTFAAIYRPGRAALASAAAPREHTGC